MLLHPCRFVKAEWLCRLFMALVGKLASGVGGMGVGAKPAAKLLTRFVSPIQAQNAGLFVSEQHTV